MSLDPGQTKSGVQARNPQNKETPTTATKDKDEKTRNSKSEDAPTLARTPKTPPQSTTKPQKLNENEIENSKSKVPKLKEDKVENSTTSVAESPATVYYVSKLFDPQSSSKSTIPGCVTGDGCALPHLWWDSGWLLPGRH